MNSLVIEPEVSAPLINSASEPNPDKDTHHDISHESHMSMRCNLNTVKSLYKDISSVTPPCKKNKTGIETITVKTKGNKTYNM
jgi:hypothetical protein